MKAGLSEIVLVLDRSGSMATTKQDAEGGLMHFLEGQRSVPGELRITLYRFNEAVERVFDNKPAAEVLGHELKIQPDGFTALLDAIGQAILEVGTRLSGTAEDQRPERVFVVVVTDGEENRSQRYTHKQVFDQVTIQREKYKWEFVFIGANIDAIKVGQQIGVPISSAMPYRANARGTQAAYRGAGQAVMQARVTGQQVNFTASMRSSAMDEDDKGKQQVKPQA